MKAKHTRVLVVAFTLATLGAMSMAPRIGYSLSADPDNPAQERIERNIEARKAYEDAYNRAFEQAKKAEEDKLTNEEAGEEEGGCCG